MKSVHHTHSHLKNTQLPIRPRNKTGGGYTEFVIVNVGECINAKIIRIERDRCTSTFVGRSTKTHSRISRWSTYGVDDCKWRCIIIWSHRGTTNNIWNTLCGCELPEKRRKYKRNYGLRCLIKRSTAPALSYSSLIERLAKFRQYFAYV